MSFQIFGCILALLCTLAFVQCDYYGEGFPVDKPIHGARLGGPGIRYKKIPLPYRSGRNYGPLSAGLYGKPYGSF